MLKNSEILFLYDAKLCNPNGDPDEENRPRMDYERDVNLVSDLRLKRYLRDYLALQGEEIFVAKIDDEPVKAATRIEKLGKELGKDEILDRLIDVRLFGATMPIEKNTMTFTGPLQFNWGYSLNKVQLLESSITSHFSSDEGKSQGAMGKDYRVKYSLLAFSGIFSGHRAIKTRAKEEDLTKLDLAMVKAIPLLATRSKVGQYPRLYLRVEYVDQLTVLGDLRSYISLVEKNEDLRDISEAAIQIEGLVQHLAANVDRIHHIYYYQNKDLELMSGSETGDLENLLGDKLRGKLVEVR
ncbi:MAG: type I-B CRISPR-associated protein Cas7/Csh2 [Clostridia bacterium]|nr:type I-B CRISPR-associated protein Cas7/Csh2 [Clostridia bacterium]